MRINILAFAVVMASLTASCSSNSAPIFDGATMDAGSTGDTASGDASRADQSVMDRGTGGDALTTRDQGTTSDSGSGPLCGRYVYANGQTPVFVNTCTNGVCRFTCLRPDRCGGVTCRSNETCYDGRCVPGCFTYPGVSCPAGQRAIVAPDGSRLCVGALDRGECNDCADDEYCRANCVPTDPCAAVLCGAGSCCVNGACVTRAQSPCCGVACAIGTLCANGVCVGGCSGRAVGASGMESEADAQNCHMSCPSGMRCVLGQCQPTPCSPNCPSDFARAAVADGCGGVCPCRAGSPYNGTCCTPTCTTPCASDNCGGTCPAPAGSVCNNGTLCTPSCTSANACAPDGCGGVCPGCNGAGQMCSGGSCCTRNCPSDFSRAGASDGCGGVCGCPMYTSPVVGATPFCCPFDHAAGYYGPQATPLCCPSSAPPGTDDNGRWFCCTPNCQGRAGQSNGCGDLCACPNGQQPFQNNCCTPSGSPCAYNGCGAYNPAPTGAVCFNGTICTPSCTGLGGGYDGCGGTCPCAPGTEYHDGACCAPSCAAACASNGCGSLCPAPSGSVCYNGTVCTPSCTPGMCGTDGCGGNCRCSSGTTCANGACVSCPTSCPPGQYLQGCSCIPIG